MAEADHFKVSQLSLHNEDHAIVASGISWGDQEARVENEVGAVFDHAFNYRSVPKCEADPKAFERRQIVEKQIGVTAALFKLFYEIDPLSLGQGYLFNHSVKAPYADDAGASSPAVTVTVNETFNDTV